MEARLGGISLQTRYHRKHFKQNKHQILTLYCNDFTNAFSFINICSNSRMMKFFPKAKKDQQWERTV